jgi:hypothetical protein
MNGCIPEIHHVGDFDQVCPHCHSRSWRNEKINCCASGAIVLPNFPDVPQDLSNLIFTPHVRSNIRKYNMAMAMASVGHQNISLPDGMFTLGGKSFHRIGSLRPAEALPHAFAQIYMLDAQEASDRRIRVQGGRDSENPLRPEILSQLHTWMLLHNPWVRQFVAAFHNDMPQLVWRSSDDISSMQMGALVAQPGSTRDIVIERQVPSVACCDLLLICLGYVGNDTAIFRIGHYILSTTAMLYTTHCHIRYFFHLDLQDGMIKCQCSELIIVMRDGLL